MWKRKTKKVPIATFGSSVGAQVQLGDPGNGDKTPDQILDPKESLIMRTSSRESEIAKRLNLSNTPHTSFLV